MLGNAFRVGSAAYQLSPSRNIMTIQDIDFEAVLEAVSGDLS